MFAKPGEFRQRLKQATDVDVDFLRMYEANSSCHTNTLHHVFVFASKKKSTYHFIEERFV